MNPTDADKLQSALRRNLDGVRTAIRDAAARAGRAADDIRLVVVTKYAPPQAIRALPGLGVRDLGESRVQQLTQRSAWFTPEDSVVWHMVGHLQRNKVRALLRCGRVIHSLDSLRLIEEVQAQAAKLDVFVDGFVELNLAGESDKTGAPPELAEPLVEAAARADRIRLRGLMTMAPYADDPELSRPVFVRLRETLESLRTRGVAPPDCDQLSMGMSGDFAVAVEEGATVVRIGSRLFEGLT